MKDYTILQEEYYDYVKNTPIKLQNLLNGGKVLKIEKHFLTDFKPKRILDIGCGTGERTFPFYEKRGIDFLGIEREESIINLSKYRDKIIKKDITDENITLPSFDFDLIVLWGVIIGIILEEKRQKLWQNLRYLMEKNNSHLAFTTRTDFLWFKNEEKGKVIKINENFPPQYFPSEKEIKNTLLSYKLKLIKTYKDENITLYHISL